MGATSKETGKEGEERKGKGRKGGEVGEGREEKGGSRPPNILA